MDVRLGRGIRHAVLPLSLERHAGLGRIPRVAGFARGAVGAGMLDRDRSEPRRRRRRATEHPCDRGGRHGQDAARPLLGEAGPRERIVLLEDVAELRTAHPHVAALEARQANLEGRDGSASTSSSARRRACAPTGSWWGAPRARAPRAAGGAQHRSRRRGGHAPRELARGRPPRDSRHSARPPPCRPTRSRARPSAPWTSWCTSSRDGRRRVAQIGRFRGLDDDRLGVEPCLTGRAAGRERWREVASLLARRRRRGPTSEAARRVAAATERLAAPIDHGLAPAAAWRNVCTARRSRGWEGRPSDGRCTARGGRRRRRPATGASVAEAIERARAAHGDASPAWSMLRPRSGRGCRGRTAGRCPAMLAEALRSQRSSVGCCRRASPDRRRALGSWRRSFPSPRSRSVLIGFDTIGRAHRQPRRPHLPRVRLRPAVGGRAVEPFARRPRASLGPACGRPRAGAAGGGAYERRLARACREELVDRALRAHLPGRRQLRRGRAGAATGRARRLPRSPNCCAPRRRASAARRVPRVCSCGRARRAPDDPARAACRRHSCCSGSRRLISVVTGTLGGGDRPSLVPPSPRQRQMREESS